MARAVARGKDSAGAKWHFLRCRLFAERVFRPALDNDRSAIYRHLMTSAITSPAAETDQVSESAHEIRGISSVRSVERAMEILTALSKAEGPMSITELARAVGLPYATVQRLLLVHEKSGFVQKDRHLYRLGPSVVTLAGAYLAGDSLVRASQPILDELAQFTNETVSLHVRQGADRIVVMWHPSVHPLGYVFQVGQRRPLLLGAAGYILSAEIPEEELLQLLAEYGELRLADGTVLSREEWAARLEGARQRGFAVSRSDSIVGSLTVAAPVRKPGHGAIAAVAVSAAEFRMTDEKIEDFARLVREAGQEISRVYMRM